MHARTTGLLLALILTVGVAPGALAKKFRYASGPQAPADSALAVPNPYLEPVVRSRGPRVPYTNLQLVAFTADTAAERVLRALPLERGMHVLVAPAHEHSMNFALENALLKQLTRHGVEVTVRHSPVPDDSVATVSGRNGDPLLEYTLNSARVSYLRLVGWLPGRVKIERQAIVQGSLLLRDPATSRILWTSDLAYTFMDRFPRAQMSLVDDPHYPELKDEVPARGVDKLVEPVIVVTIVSGLVALFFQNRP